MYTELLPGGQILALFITSLTDGMAGTYYCSASYANTEPLDASVDIQTYGKYSNALKYFTHTIKKKTLKTSGVDKVLNAINTCQRDCIELTFISFFILFCRVSIEN